MRSGDPWRSSAPSSPAGTASCPEVNALASLAATMIRPTEPDGGLPPAAGKSPAWYTGNTTGAWPAERWSWQRVADQPEKNQIWSRSPRPRHKGPMPGPAQRPQDLLEG